MGGSSHSPRARWFAAAELAAAQHGAIARRQLRELGFSERRIDGAVATGRLFQLYRFAYALGHRGVGSMGRLSAAALACGEGSVISHRSAAHLLGIWDRPPPDVELIAPIDAGRKIPGIKRRHVIAVAAAEAWVWEGIPCTSPARTIVDLAGIAPEAKLRRAVEAAAVRDLLDPARIRAILARRRRRGAPLLRLILEEWPTSAVGRTLRSPFEARLLAAMNRAGIEPAAVNLTLVIEGQRLEVDFCWPHRRLVAEADGAAYHDNPVARARDAHRDALLESAGYRVFRLRWSDLDRRPEATIHRIRRALSRSAVP